MAVALRTGQTGYLSDSGFRGISLESQRPLTIW